MLLLLSFKITVNVTDSMPKGIYILSKPHNLQNNDMVLICPDKRYMFKLARERKYFPSFGRCLDSSPLLKYIVASNGDMVEVSSSVFINGIWYGNVHNIDSKKRLLNPVKLSKKLEDHEYFVMNFHEQSFDSRYFGIIKYDLIIAKAKELWIW